MTARQFYIPNRPPGRAVDSRKEEFARLNELVTARGGWLTSIAGADDPIRMDALPDSTLPDQLRALGYTVKRTGETQRILPHAIVENFVADRTGAFVPATAGSTRPIVHSVRHAGIVAVDQWELYGGPPPDQGMRIAPWWRALTPTHRDVVPCNRDR